MDEGNMQASSDGWRVAEVEGCGLDVTWVGEAGTGGSRHKRKTNSK